MLVFFFLGRVEKRLHYNAWAIDLNHKAILLMPEK
jgi:hypothetical protein